MSDPIDIPGDQHPQQITLDYTLPGGAMHQVQLWEDDNHSVTIAQLASAVEDAHQLADVEVHFNGAPQDPSDDAIAGWQYQIVVPVPAGHGAGGDDEIFPMDP